MNDNVRTIAVISCTYFGDSVAHLDRMLSSVFGALLPENYRLNFYLHIDGKISDEHMATISRFPLFKVITSASSQGLAIGLNKLVDELEGEDYIFRMDADDVCLRERFINQIEFMEQNRCVDLLGGGIFEFIGSENNVVNTRNYPRLDLMGYLEKASPFAHVTICFRNGFFDKFGKYPEQYPLNEDIAYWFQALQNGAIGDNLNEGLVLVRMDGAYNRRSFSKARSEFKVYRKIAKYRNKIPWYASIRFLFRLLPPRVVESVYNSTLRTKFLNRIGK
ncbi:glycosyltransferase [Vibrio splendidus]|uniref:glycosyltransferase n=1 Tax=Vibrio splendidus TaxID=29497 RepID=UPI000D34666E|nr:glycosyltransferase [Vibrio splendidus]PTO65216.1 hypothetical protein CWN99_08825 [Vibrio splendidus]